MQLDFEGRSALVTGGAVGIGRSIAKALAHHGVDVVITHWTHSPEELLAEVAGATGKVTALRLNAMSSTDVDEQIDRAAETLGGRIDYLVNNSGGLIGRVPIAEMTDDHWRTVVDVNLSSAFYCTRAALRHMRAGGRIVNISSLAARSGGGSGAVAYATAKAGLEGFTRASAKELAPQGILVNAIAPGFIGDTPFHLTFTPPAAQQATVESLPVGRAGRPDDVAGAALYLLSSFASFCTGITLDVSGGAY